MAAPIFYPFAITLDTASDIVIDGISSCSIDSGGTVTRPQIDGAALPRLAFIANYQAAIDFTTMNIKQILDMVSATGDCLNGRMVTGTEALLMYSQKALAGGSRDPAANVHNKYTINEALIIPTSLSASGSEPASITVAIMPIASDTNPIVYATAQALPTAAAATKQIYYCGPGKLNNTEVSIQSLSINFGLNAIPVSDNGKADPDMIYIENKMPVITIETTDISLAATYARGVAISTSTKFWLTAGVNGGSRTANATNAHPTFTVTDGMIKSRAISGSHQTMAIDIYPTYDGTNAMITYDIEAIS